MSIQHEIKIFSLTDDSMFDLNTYIGRLKHFAKMTDIRQIFLTKTKIENYKNILKDFEQNPQKLIDGNMNISLWNAKYGIKSAVNSDTGKTIPIPARLCAFVPMNIPIAFGLMCLPATHFNILFFNFLNQSYNAMMNYSNGSGTEDSMRYLTISYSMAIISSLGSALLLKRRFSRQKNIGICREAVLRILPSSIAGFLNLFFIRSDYIIKGINVRDEKGEILGVSKVCGRRAILEGALSRALLPIPLLINHFIVKFKDLFKFKKKLNIAIELFLCAIALGVGLPCSIAIFKEHSKIEINNLEHDIKIKAEEKNLKYVYYNKGL